MKHIFVGKWIPGMKRYLDARFRNEITGRGRERLRWWDWYMRHWRNISLTARHFGISRNTMYRWLIRFQPGALGSLENRSSRPKHCRARTVRLHIEERVCELRERYNRYGKKKIQVILKMEGIQCSASSVGRIIREKGFFDARRKHRTTTARFRPTILRQRRPQGLTLSKPGQVIEMDSVIIQHNGQKRTLITAIDLATRVAFADIYKTPHAAAAWAVLLKFQELLGTKIRAVHTDNGSEFLGVFNDNCMKFKITHYFSHPRTPKQHAHIERFNRTIQDEGIQPIHLILPIAQLREELAAFLTTYNLFRPHASLHYQTPFRYYFFKRYPKFSSTQLFNRYWSNTTAVF